MPKNVYTNPDVSYVQGIINGLIKKGGYCPCRVQKNEDTLCPCKSIREEQKCCCKLYLIKED